MRVVIVFGLPGSGKSYFSERLAARLDAAYVNSDKIRLSMKALGKYSAQDKIAVYEEMARKTRKFLNEGKTVVVDATFYLEKIRNLFINLLSELSPKLFLIEVYSDETLICERLMKPRQHSEADFDVYKKIKKEFETVSVPHLKLESTKDNITLMLNKAVQYLKNEGG